MKIKNIIVEYGALIVPFLLALICIALISAGSHQAILPKPMQQSFHGEYRYENEETWTELTQDNSLSALKGNLIIRGHFEKDIAKDWLLCFYRNHIGISMYVNDELVYLDAVTQVADSDVKLFTSMCGREWDKIKCPEISVKDTVEFHLYNPHAYGNRAAYNEFLSTLCCEMEGYGLLQESLKQDSIFYKVIGVFMIVASFMLLGASIIAIIIQSPFKSHLLRVCLMTLFSGAYIFMDVIDISFFNEWVAFNTYAKQICMMLGVYYLGQYASGYITGTKGKIGRIVISVSGIMVCILIVLSFTGVMVIYDTFPYWVAMQTVVCLVMLVCCCMMCRTNLKQNGVVLIPCVLIFAAILLDICGIGANMISVGTCTKVLFLMFFVTYVILGAKTILIDHQASVRASKLENELEESRIAIMLSQIQPHFLYNALGTIRGLCRKEPEQAWEALGDFSKYLRGNMSALTNKESIYFTSELHHIEAYLRLEKVRMGERLNILYDIQEKDFLIPPLTVQPLVENAIKHGLFDKAEGGTLILHTRKENNAIVISIKDNGLGFDENEPLTQDDHHAHIGLANVRARLKKMVDGQLIIESTPGEGTSATIILPTGISGKT